jgi:hypothetical protein
MRLIDMILLVNRDANIKKGVTPWINLMLKEINNPRIILLPGLVEVFIIP